VRRERPEPADPGQRLENLARECKGKVCVLLDLDRQLFPFCKPEDLDGHVREAVEALGLPEGGLMLHAECADDVPLENIEASVSRWRSIGGISGR